jgi:molybdopterin-guanine dinucleotide biosynthesis protein A
VRVEDRPKPGLGPLGGLAGALAYAEEHGFDAVLTAACDLPLLPHDLAARLGEPDVIVGQQPTVGLWRADHAALLATHIASDPRRSLRGWADRVGARVAMLDPPLANINAPGDLAAMV